MPAIVEFPQVVRDAVDEFGDLFLRAAAAAFRGVSHRIDGGGKQNRHGHQRRVRGYHRPVVSEPFYHGGRVG